SSGHSRATGASADLRTRRAAGRRTRSGDLRFGHARDGGRQVGDLRPWWVQVGGAGIDVEHDPIPPDGYDSVREHTAWSRLG
ncbi:hypothetical protein NJ76_31180, partial [Rhodococcus sp. IITR03]